MVSLYRIYLKDFLRNYFISKTNCLRILFIAPFQQQRSLALLNKLTFFLVKYRDESHLNDESHDSHPVCNPKN